MYVKMTLPTLRPNQASFKLQVWISMVGTCQIDSESEQAHSTTSWQVLWSKPKWWGTPTGIRRALKPPFHLTLRFQLKKDAVKIGQALKTAVITAAQGTGWVNAVLICDDFPELGTNLVSALASQTREMCRCIRMPQHVRNWLENTWGMSEEGTRVHNTAPRRETKRPSYRAYNPISDIWPPWTCTSSRMAAREVERERQRLWGCLRATGRWQLPRNFNMTSIARPNKQILESQFSAI